MLKRLTLHQTGDTIVEVLLALTVTVTVLTGAYVIAGRALRIGRLAEERTQATKLAQGQVEAISALARASQPTAAIPDKLQAVGIPDDPVGANPTCMPVWNAATWAVSQVAASGALNCTKGLYTVSVAREAFPMVGGYPASLRYGGQFRVTVSWPSLGSDNTSGIEKVEIHYRAYEGI